VCEQEGEGWKMGMGKEGGGGGGGRGWMGLATLVFNGGEAEGPDEVRASGAGGWDWEETLPAACTGREGSDQ